MKWKFKKIVSLILAMCMIISTGIISSANEGETGLNDNEILSGEIVNDTVISEGAVETQSSDISTFSLLPLEEIEAEIDLTDLLPIELENITVAELLNRMVCTETGEPVVINENDTTVWSEYYTEDGELISDAWEKEELNKTFNLKEYVRSTSSYSNTIEIIVGSGNQLDSDNIRYITKIILPKMSDIYNFKIYNQTEKEGEILRESISSLGFYSDYYYIDEYGNHYYYKVENSSEVHEIEFDISSKYDIDDEYYLGFETSGEEENDFWDSQNIEVEVYDGMYTSAEEAITAASSDPNINLTSQMVNVDMEGIDVGIKYKWADNDDKILTFVYRRNGEIIGFENINVLMSPMNNWLSVDRPYLLNEYNSKYRNVIYKTVYDEDYLNDDQNKVININTYYTYKEYSASDEFYVNMHYYFDGKLNTSMIEKAVIGLYNSIEEASLQSDIKNALFADSYKDAYKTRLDGDGVDFTIFTEYETYYYRLIIEQGDFTYEESEEEPSDNTYVSFYGLYNADSDDPDKLIMLDTYKLPSEHDYYADNYNYITFLVLDDDSNSDMTAIIPRIYKSDANSKIYCEGELEKTEGEYSYFYLSPRDFTKIPSDLEENPRNSVRYTVTAENEEDQENYIVTAVKSENGPRLFVNGPDKREVILDSYYGKYHDILIANIGTEELKNIEVVLDADNVRLDDYWTIGGDGNNTLAAFETTTSNGSYNSSEEIQNIAKIRLVPDGDGIIDGTLTITADGQEPRVIKIEGYAGDPKIDTTSLKDGVKYVPYQTIITTNNKYDWNDVEFELVDGELPEGIELKPDGEIYGVPKETGAFTVTIRANFSYYNFESSTVTLTLNILDNTDENVDNQTDIEDGFEITDRIENISIYEGDSDDDQIFEFDYDYAEHIDEFQDFWLDGEKLIKNVDYTIESGSTKITIKSQTFSNAGDGTHTIAAEYRNTSNQVKKAAQNYSRTTNKKSSGSSSGSSGSTTGSSSGGGGGSVSGTINYVYTVTYESNGGSVVEAQKVVRGQKISFLATPEKPGYRFVGWYTDAELTNKFDETKAITSSIKLYAKYEQVECTVWFDSNGGIQVNSIEILGDTALNELPVTQKDGYEFIGWFTEDGNQFNDGDKIYANTTLYAKWELIIPDEAPDNISGFIDVNTSSWYYNDIAWIYDNNIMIGYNNAIFAPDDIMVLSNIVTVLAKLSGDDLQLYDSIAVEGVHEDVWYTLYAKWALSNEIIDYTQFNPNAEISREDLAVILVRFLDYIGAEYTISDEEISFNDSQFISEYAKNAIEILYKLGVLSGRGNGIIDPNSYITRAEFAALVHRMNSLI